ncbi:hypothetical protein BDV28DRAFT_143786, partial [Aspergillus coremiiformis]
MTSTMQEATKNVSTEVLRRILQWKTVPHILRTLYSVQYVFIYYYGVGSQVVGFMCRQQPTTRRYPAPTVWRGDQFSFLFRSLPMTCLGVSPLSSFL